MQAGENAVFVGPDSIRNIISRVTGGRPSTLDGGLYVQVPQADFYFLNPAGAGEVSLEEGIELNASGGRIHLEDNGGTAANRAQGFANLDSRAVGWADGRKVQHTPKYWDSFLIPT